MRVSPVNECVCVCSGVTGRWLGFKWTLVGIQTAVPVAGFDGSIRLAPVGGGVTQVLANTVPVAGDRATLHLCSHNTGSRQSPSPLHSSASWLPLGMVSA